MNINYDTNAQARREAAAMRRLVQTPATRPDMRPFWALVAVVFVAVASIGFAL